MSRPSLQAFGHEWPLIVTRLVQVKTQSYLTPDPSMSAEEQKAAFEKFLRTVLPEGSEIEFDLVDDHKLSPADRAEYDRLADEALAAFENRKVA